MRRLCVLTLSLLLIASPAWSMSASYRHLEPETVVYQGLPSAAQTQFTTNENIKLIKYTTAGVTLTALTANLSQIDGTAFVSTPSVDLRPYIGFKGTWSDVGTAGVGWFGVAGTGETKNTSVIVNGDMELNSNWANYGAPTTNAQSNTQAHSPTHSRHFIPGVAYDGIKSDVFSVIKGQLWYFSHSYYPTVATTNHNAGIQGGGTNFTPLLFTGSFHTGEWTNLTGYATADATTAAAYYFVDAYLKTAGDFYVDDVGLQLVLTPSLLGTTITATNGGAQNWGTKGSTPNAATFNVVVTRQ